MIYLSPVNGIKCAYGEETCWVWAEKTFKNNSFILPQNYNNDDVVLRYSTCEPINAKPANVIALCWELLPEMKIVLKQNTGYCLRFESQDVSSTRWMSAGALDISPTIDITVITNIMAR